METNEKTIEFRNLLKKLGLSIESLDYCTSIEGMRFCTYRLENKSFGVGEDSEQGLALDAYLFALCAEARKPKSTNNFRGDLNIIEEHTSEEKRKQIELGQFVPLSRVESERLEREVLKRVSRAPVPFYRATTIPSPGSLSDYFSIS